MKFEDQLHALIFFHLQEHHSCRHLLQSLKEDAFAGKQIAPKKGIVKSFFLRRLSDWGLEQLLLLFKPLQSEIGKTPRQNSRARL
ncbi:MAG: hypothetical protein Q4G66_08470 [bacterium]|nr:hypothetical protein [bacterium]